MLRLTLKEVQTLTSEILNEVNAICKKEGIKYYLAYGSALGAVRHHGPIPWDYDMDLIVLSSDFDKFFDAMRKNLSDKFYLDFFDITPNYCFVFPRIGLKGYSTDEVHVDVFQLVGIPNDMDEREKFLKKLLNVRTKLFLKNRPINRSLRSIIGRGLQKLSCIFSTNEKLRKDSISLSKMYPIDDVDCLVDTNAHKNQQFVYKKEVFGDGREIQYETITSSVPSKVEIYLTERYGDYMTLPPENERTFKDQYIVLERELVK